MPTTFNHYPSVIRQGDFYLTPMTDQDYITFGKHRGKKLIDVPADYLIWIYENNKCDGPLRKYIRENMDAIKLETKNK